MVRPLLSLLLVLAFAVPSVLSTTYYVSNTAGSASNSGTVPISPLSTLSDAGVAGLQSGDAVLLCQGETWSNTALNLNINGVTYGSYQCGCSADDPVITSSIPVPASRWSSRDNNLVLSASLTSLAFPSSSVGAVWVAGVRYLPARNPPLQDPIKTYFQYPTDSFTVPNANANYVTYITPVPTLNQEAGHWQGATLRIREFTYTYQTYTVAQSSSSGQLNLDGWNNGYYVAAVGNEHLFLEWAHRANTTSFLPFLVPYTFLIDDATSTLYISVPDSTARTGVSSGSIPVWISPMSTSPVTVRASSVTVQGWNITYAASNLVDASSAYQFTLSSSTVTHAATTVNYARCGCQGCPDGNHCPADNGNCVVAGASAVVHDSFIDDCEQFGVWVGSNSVVRSNVITRSSIISGYTEQSGGVNVAGSSVSVSNNYIGQSGYAGVLMGGGGNTVDGNTIVDSMLTLIDGGAIYTYGTSGHQITNNVIDGVMGSYETQQAICIYLDDNTAQTTVRNNTCNHALECIFFHEGINHIAADNTCYSSGIKIKATGTGTLPGDTNYVDLLTRQEPRHVVRGNKVYFYGLSWFVNSDNVVTHPPQGLQNYAMYLYATSDTARQGVDRLVYLVNNVYCTQQVNSDATLWQVTFPGQFDQYGNPLSTSYNVNQFSAYQQGLVNYGSNSFYHQGAESGSMAYDNRAGEFNTFCPPPPSSKPTAPVFPTPASTCSAATPLSPTFAVPLVSDGVDLVTLTTVYFDVYRTSFSTTPTRGNAVYFQAGAGFLTTPLPTSYSLCEWVNLFTPGDYGYPNVLYATDDFLFGLDNSANLFVSKGSVNQPSLYNVTFNLSGGLSSAINSWTHYCTSYDAVTAALSLYVNGTQVASTVQNGGAGGWTGSLSGGRIGYGSDQAYELNGWVQGVAIYNGVISSQQLQRIYSGQSNGAVGVQNIGTYNSFQ